MRSIENTLVIYEQLETQRALLSTPPSSIPHDRSPHVESLESQSPLLHVTLGVLCKTTKLQRSVKWKIVMSQTLTGLVRAARDLHSQELQIQTSTLLLTMEETAGPSLLEGRGEIAHQGSSAMDDSAMWPRSSTPILQRRNHQELRRSSTSREEVHTCRLQHSIHEEFQIECPLPRRVESARYSSTNCIWWRASGRQRSELSKTCLLWDQLSSRQLLCCELLFSASVWWTMDTLLMIIYHGKNAFTCSKSEVTECILTFSSCHLRLRETRFHLNACRESENSVSRGCQPSRTWQNTNERSERYLRY